MPFGTPSDGPTTAGTTSDPVLTTAAAAAVATDFRDWALDVQAGLHSDLNTVHKFGRLPVVNSADGFVDVWNGTKGPYLGFNAVAGEAVTVSSASANDAGTVLSSGTMTGGSATTAADTGATFSTDTVAAGDLVINDTQSDHMIITSLTETVLTGRRWRHGTTPAVSDAYRVVTAASTGAAVVRVNRIMDFTSGGLATEYIVLNGVTGVDTTGTDYFRCSRGRIVLAASGGIAIGAITATQKTTTANIFWTMPIGYNSTMVCCDTVPAGKVGYLKQWGGQLIGTNQANAQLRFSSRPTGEVFQVQEELGLRGSGTSAIDRVYSIPKNGFEAWTDIRLDIDTDTNATSVVGYFTIIFKDA